MIRMHDLTKIYRTNEVETTALNSVDAVIDQGEFVAVMGPSGCGKSTFLNVAGLLDTPTSGQYLFLLSTMASRIMFMSILISVSFTPPIISMAQA